MPDGAHRRGVLGAKGIVAVASLCLTCAFPRGTRRRRRVAELSSPPSISLRPAPSTRRELPSRGHLRATCCFVLRAGLEPAEWPPCSVLGISRHLRPQFSTSNCQRPFTTSKTLGAALAPIASRRRAHRRRQTPPTGAAMKLFAYEHPSGPVHEVEVTLGDTAHWRRPRRSNASTHPRRRHARSPQVLQLKSKIEQAMRNSAWESNSGIPLHVAPASAR